VAHVPAASSRPRRVGGVVTQRIANPCTGVRFSYSPPFNFKDLDPVAPMRNCDCHTLCRTFLFCSCSVYSKLIGLLTERRSAVRKPLRSAGQNSFQLSAVDSGGSSATGRSLYYFRVGILALTDSHFDLIRYNHNELWT
jgi:hypothetical protein